VPGLSGSVGVGDLRYRVLVLDDGAQLAAVDVAGERLEVVASPADEQREQPYPGSGQ
jgi:hypothetical protein